MFQDQQTWPLILRGGEGQIRPFSLSAVWLCGESCLHERVSVCGGADDWFLITSNQHPHQWWAACGVLGLFYHCCKCWTTSRLQRECQGSLQHYLQKCPCRILHRFSFWMSTYWLNAKFDLVAVRQDILKDTNIRENHHLQCMNVRKCNIRRYLRSSQSRDRASRASVTHFSVMASCLLGVGPVGAVRLCYQRWQRWVPLICL